MDKKVEEKLGMMMADIVNRVAFVSLLTGLIIGIVLDELVRLIWRLV